MFKKRPVIIEARLLAGDSDQISDIVNWCHGTLFLESGKPLTVTIGTLEGIMTANYGDYVVKGIQGEFYPCKPDIFLASYEAMDEVGTVEPTRMDDGRTS